jgi:excinuclease UvrABC ATPase subunit
VESISAYAAVSGTDAETEVDAIEGLQPSIALTRRTISRRSRSKGGTITEITDLCAFSMRESASFTVINACRNRSRIRDYHPVVMRLPRLKNPDTLAIVREAGGNTKSAPEDAVGRFCPGTYRRAMMDLKQDISIKKQSRHTIES